MRINSRKIQKILGKVWTAPKHIFETFCTQEAPRCIGMNATLTTFYLIQKIKQGFFLYYISCKENKCRKNFKIMRKSLFNYSLYSHPEIENFRV
jgi:predicted KAP-like P-loop ATPase